MYLLLHGNLAAVPQQLQDGHQERSQRAGNKDHEHAAHVSQAQFVAVLLRGGGIQLRAVLNRCHVSVKVKLSLCLTKHHAMKY